MDETDIRLAPIPRVSLQRQTALINSYKNAASPPLCESIENEPRQDEISLLLAEVWGSCFTKTKKQKELIGCWLRTTKSIN